MDASVEQLKRRRAYRDEWSDRERVCVSVCVEERGSCVYVCGKGSRAC